MPLLPSDGIRRVLSTLAGGILLEGGLGIADPCEKTRADTFASLTQQGTWDRFAYIQSNAIIKVIENNHYSGRFWEYSFSDKESYNFRAVGS